MGLMPRPAIPVGRGNWALELNYSASNNFQASDEVQRYLERRGGPRRPLDEADVKAVLTGIDGNRYLIDGEFGLFDLGIHYGLSERLSISARASYLSYGGGYLDGTIFDFHDTFGFGQAGREFLAPDHFQIILAQDNRALVLLDRPTAGGFTDPLFTVTYTFPGPADGWRFAVEAGVKPPLADADTLLSTGSVDLGAQLIAQRQWRAHGVVVNLAWVLPGEFEEAEAFDPPDLPSLNVAYGYRFSGRVRGIAQVFFSENIFREVNDSDLSELEFQLSAGVKIDAIGARLGLGITENLFNFDNTPDFAVHLSYSILFD